MKRKGYLTPAIMAAVLALLFSACAAGGDRRNLPRTNAPTERELRDNWKDYSVHRWGLRRPKTKNTVAIVFQQKNETKVTKVEECCLFYKKDRAQRHHNFSHLKL